MLKIRILLYTTFALSCVWLLSGCETSINTDYQTRFFYKGKDDPYMSRGSGITNSTGFVTFNKESE